MPSESSRILICRTDNIGDVVLTLPLAGFLKQHIPGVEVDMLCRAYAAPVARCSAFIDRALALEELDIERFFQEQAYDTVIFAFPHRALAAAARRAGVPNRVGSSHRLHHWWNCNRLAHFTRARSRLHEAQLNFALLKPLGMDHLPPLPEIVPLYGLQAPHGPDIAELFRPAPFNLVLHPKSNGNGREWPLARYAELTARLAGDPGIAIWITGSRAEGELLAREAPALLASPNVRSLCGRYDLGGLVSLIGMADGLIASGTGPLHISAALGRNTLGLFPPVQPIDIARWGALGANATSLCGARQCDTCTGAQACTCMAAISAAQVADVVLQWRDGSAARHADRFAEEP
ncbi:glycosyltransferase family 9 protein [Pseudoduganella albidiflava]|uniref:Glycosyl transferase family 9 n=1 Tax=Pseudoduganella albidiflava TaxID=321983 RepID=A0A411WWS3_9BURK|nr:glycosyltransferase family 9 protein [Pseudoduganella albidiflava]QBI01241.1 lipopolysaccharide heptosyltransferase family protein [Pseudoduganella albidiflava]GGY49297.1 glycosyl transferase family 9 [Pseudoduganella albidiflava]